MESELQGVYMGISMAWDEECRDVILELNMTPLMLL